MVFKPGALYLCMWAISVFHIFCGKICFGPNEWGEWRDVAKWNHLINYIVFMREKLSSIFLVLRFYIKVFSLYLLFNPRLFSASQPRNAINRYERCYLYVAYDCVFVCLVMYFAVLHIYNPTMHKHVVLCVLSFSVYALCYTLYARRITFIFEKSALSLSHTFSRAHTTTTTTKLFRDNFRPEMKICVHRRK